MMKRVVWSIQIALVFLIAAPVMAGPRHMQLLESDAGKTIQLDPHTVAVIELQSQPATGNGWRAVQPLSSRLKIVGSELEPLTSGLIGGWVKEKIYVVAAGRGPADLQFEYRRSFERTSSAELKFSFKAQGQFVEAFNLPAPAVEAPTAPLEPDTASADVTALPTSFNWCEQNGCTPVKDQGNCGSCWAFATVAPLESLIQLNDGATVDLSEQYLVSCNSEGWGCDGGFWAHDYHQWKKVNGETAAGAVLESNFPYRGIDAACNPPHSKSQRIDSWQYVCPNCNPTTAQIKQAIYAHGPLSATVCVNTAFQNYTGGTFSGPGCSTANHGVTLVGWDDGSGSWIMRNSWGPRWGEAGYMHIKYGVSGIGENAAYVDYGASPNPDPGPDPDPDPQDGELDNGQAVSGLSAARGDWLYYYISVPEGASNLRISISGGTGDVDLYTRFGTQPSTYLFDCRPYRNSNNEECTFAVPEAGEWHIGLHGYLAFSGVTLTASYDETVPNPDPEAQCTTSDNLSHVWRGRAYLCGWLNACAAGSNDNLGRARTTVITSLKAVADNYWQKTDSCP